jgi:hypothetical protein
VADPYISNVRLLIRANGTDASTTFADSGPDRRSITAVGNAQIDTAQSKWGGSSALFDGNGDRLSLINDSALRPTGDFTVECWVRFASIASARTFIIKGTGFAQSPYVLYFSVSAGNRFAFRCYDTGGAVAAQVTGTSSPTTGVWYHVAGVRDGNTFRLFIDGTQEATATYSGSLWNGSESLYIGSDSANTNPHNGWLDDVRITIGTARYTANFTAPTAEFEGSPDPEGTITTSAALGDVRLLGTSTVSADTENSFEFVSLLLHCNGTDAATTFTDTSQYGHIVTANGDAQVDTAQKKWGTGSALFDGTGDYLTVPDNASLQLSSGDWTVECYVRLNSTAANAIIMQRAVGTGSYPWQLWFDSSTTKLGFRGQRAGSVTEYDLKSSVVTTGVWYHIAGVRDGNTARFFVDGVSAGTSTIANTLFSATSASLSIGGSDTAAAILNGWIDDLRITKGVARYTTDFEVQAAELKDGNDKKGTITTAAVLGSPSVFGSLCLATITTAAVLGAPALTGFQLFGTISLPAVLGGPVMRGLIDFTQAVEGLQSHYTMDLVTPGGLVRVPISSWQATQQVDRDNYLQCVVPACGDWLTDLEAATEFVISRVTEFADGSPFEYIMASAPVEVLQTDRGPENYTATISGYTAGYTAEENPPEAFDRVLQDVRSISVYTSGVRLRCAIDWMLKPSQRAFYSDTSFVVSYINYYVGANVATVDEYMDVGERIEA